MGTPPALHDLTRLEVFTQWKKPDNFKIELFVIRVGDLGRHIMPATSQSLSIFLA